jgi:WD40 repeat protein/tRNA A-37 threonylcarbamoyl transferase component Bud32
MADSTDSLKLDDYLARLLAALDSGVEGGNSRAPTVDLSARQGWPSQGGVQAEAAAAMSHEGSLSEVLPGPGSAGGSLPLAPGSPLRIGRFELRRQLGKGGCGIVFLAFDPKLQREVALKIPRPEMLLSADARKRLIREAQAAAEFDHPNLVPVYETGEFGPLCYIATAFCPGQTLGQWLEKQAFPVPVRQAARLVAIVAEAVQHAHDRGVLHRDLKPNNIILQPVREDPLAEEPPVGSCQLRGEYYIPRVVDFGLAKLMERSEPSDTRTWQILGTPKYMAPEQALAKHRDLGPAADVYALGAILYELLTGCAPYDGATDVEVLRQVVDGQLNPPRQIRRDIPRDLEAICLKAMEKNPGRRYRTAIDLADDLRRFLDGKPTIARPVNWLGRAARWARRNDQLVALIIVSVIAVVMLGVGTWYMGETRRLKNDQERARSDQELRARWERQRDYAQYLHAAFLSLRSGNREEAKDYLEAARLIAGYLNEPLDFPYHYLHRLVQLPRLDIPAFENRVTALAVSADLRYLCWAYPDGTLTLWDMAQSRPVQTWKHPTPNMQHAGQTALHIAFVGPQSTTLLVCNEALEAPPISVWTLRSDDTVAPLANLPPVFQGSWFRCTTSSDGRYSCVEHQDGTVLLWDWYEQKVAAQTRWPQSARGMNVCTLPSGCEVAFITRDGAIGLWDGRSPPRMLPPLENSSHITSLAFTAEGKIAVGSNTGLWILEEGKRWKQHRNTPVRWVFSSPHGLLTYAKSGRFSLEQETRFWEWPVAEHGEITTAALDARGRMLGTAGEDGFVRLWRIPGDPQKLGVLHVPLLQRVFVSEESPHAVWLDAQKRLVPLAGAQHASLPSPALPILDAFLTRDGSLRVFLADGSTIRDEQWVGQQRQLVHHWHLPPAAQVRWAKFSRPSGHLLAADHLGRLYLWNAADIPSTAPSIIETSSGKAVAEAVLARDASLLAVRWDRSTISIWSVAESSWKLSLSVPDVTDFCFVENSGFLATAGERGAIRLWSLESGREAATFLGHIGAATCLALSPDQRTLISGGANGEVIFWDLRAQREVFRQRRHDGPVRHIRFANQGRWLITASADQVALWQTGE